MKFNLKHFLNKRNLTLVKWANDNGISSIEDYDKFMLNGEFYNDPVLREEFVKTKFAEKLSEAELEVKKNTEEILVDENITTKTETTESQEQDLNKKVLETEEKTNKKKRSKNDANVS